MMELDWTARLLFSSFFRLFLFALPTPFLFFLCSSSFALKWNRGGLILLPGQYLVEYLFFLLLLLLLLLLLPLLLLLL